MNSTRQYVSQIHRHLWDYALETFGSDAEVFDASGPNPDRPPVLVKEAVDNNVLMPHGISSEDRALVFGAVPEKERHRHYSSMRSSQALAQSVFGCLKVLGKMDVLQGWCSDHGVPALFESEAPEDLYLEHAVSHLGEPRPTSLDVWIVGSKRIAVECKFTEPDFGTCSRPRLRKINDKNYERDYCDGSYSRQQNRKSRCSLTQIGVKYWEFIPELFDWDPGIDQIPCPLRETYQLVRNVLAACVLPDGTIDAENAHALVVYDARNPAFCDGGKASAQFRSTRQSLKEPNLLRSASWQKLAAQLKKDSELDWLVEGLGRKYGIVPGDAVGISL